MPARQALQSTFDAIVREAMTDFGLSPSEAVADARVQLSKVGITDFSNLIDPVAPSLTAALRTAAESIPASLLAALDAHSPAPELTSILARFTASDATHEFVAVAGANGAVDAVIAALSRGRDDIEADDWQVADAAAAAVAALCDANEANRTRFSTSQRADGVALLKVLVAHESPPDVKSADAFARATRLLLALCVVQRHSEPVKRRVAAAGFLDTLLLLLRAATVRLADDPAVSVPLIRQLCLILRQSLAPDDAAVAVAETFNRARVLGGGGSTSESGLCVLCIDDDLPSILQQVTCDLAVCGGIEESDRVAVLTDCVSLARLLAISDEICADLHALHFDDLAISLMSDRADVASVVQSCVCLLRNLAGRDEIKGALYERMGDILVAVKRHLDSSAAITEGFAGFVASLCLRRPDLSRGLSANGALEAVVGGMRTHEGKKGVQRMGCVAVRNACARDREARRKVREGGKAEGAVRTAWRRFPKDCDEVAYAALRDLDVLGDEELRRDDRYTMPAGFFKIKPSQVKETGVGFDDLQRGR